MKIVKPKRKKHSCVQTWNATPDRVFPLLCPVRETDWVPGWDPKLVVSNSGVMEHDCIFVETESPNDAIWIVTSYEPNHFVEMYRTVPGVTVSKFSIKLTPQQYAETVAQVSYEHTALGQDGEKIVDEFTADSFSDFMSHFKAAINYYLTTGKIIEDNP